MPQSSLLGWLSKPAVVAKSAPERVQDDSAAKDELPTPPESPTSKATTGDLLPPARTSATTASWHQTAKADRKLAPNIEFRACSKDDIPNLKQLNSLLLPIPYPEHFYKEILTDPVTADLTLLAIWHPNPDLGSNSGAQSKGRLVGAIRCRLLESPPTDPTPEHRSSHNSDQKGPILYLSTLVLLSPYRSQGIATQLLNAVLKRAVCNHGVTRVGAHVWEANSEALEWYQRRGFVMVGKEEGYYRRLKPQGAVVVERRVGVMDLLPG